MAERHDRTDPSDRQTDRVLSPFDQEARGRGHRLPEKEAMELISSIKRQRYGFCSHHTGEDTGLICYEHVARMERAINNIRGFLIGDGSGGEIGWEFEEGDTLQGRIATLLDEGDGEER